jgi:hypothetical protein
VPEDFAGAGGFAEVSLDPPPAEPESPDEAEPPSLAADFASDEDAVVFSVVFSDDAVDFSPDSLLSAFFRDSEG